MNGSHVAADRRLNRAGRQSDGWITGSALSIRASIVRRSCVSHPALAGTRPDDEAEESQMAKFVYLYTGGQMAETPEAQEAELQKWGAWFGGLGDAVSDMGNPFGASATVTASGGSDSGASGAGGYSIVTADSLGDAQSKTAGCPILSSGGAVEVYEAMEM
jgi:hypothetical protein